jgi:transposase InsO family protein
VSDRGQHFLSKIVSILCKLVNVTRHHTSLYHPQSNVACERPNSTLPQSIRAYSSKQQENWSGILPRLKNTETCKIIHTCELVKALQTYP